MITASLVLYKTPDDQLERVLRCVENSSVARVYVYDNSSSEASREVCRRFAKAEYHPHENTGYGATHNLGIRAARSAGSDWHLVLNPDIWFGDGVVERLEAFAAADPSIGQVMPRVVYPDGSLQYLCKLLPRPWDLFVRRFMPKAMRERGDRRFCLRFTGYDRVMEVPYLSGCFMFFRMEALVAAGGFDERFFMYPEDIDLTRRVHRTFRTLYYPEVTVTHDHGGASYHSAKMLWVHIVNMCRYFNKWGWLVDRERTEVNRRVLEQLNYKKEDKIR